MMKKNISQSIIKTSVVILFISLFLSILLNLILGGACGPRAGMVISYCRFEWTRNLYWILPRHVLSIAIVVLGVYFLILGIRHKKLIKLIMGLFLVFVFPLVTIGTTYLQARQSEKEEKAIMQQYLQNEAAFKKICYGTAEDLKNMSKSEIIQILGLPDREEKNNFNSELTYYLYPNGKYPDECILRFTGKKIKENPVVVAPIF